MSHHPETPHHLDAAHPTDTTHHPMPGGLGAQEVAALRAAAAAGDLDAAREWGRLLCLLPADPAGQNLPYLDTDQEWPEELWLRTVVKARPRDTLAANLLAGRLVQQVDHALLAGKEETLSGRREEATRLYAGVLAADPDDPAARAGLGVLSGLFGERSGTDADARAEAAAPAGTDRVRATSRTEQTEYAFYVVEYGCQSGGSACLVVSDPAELRWALDRWLELNAGVWDEEAGLGGAWFTLTTVHGGEEKSETDLEEYLVDGALDWAALTVPPLPGPPLPVGHPGRAGELIHHYGYSVQAG